MAETLHKYQIPVYVRLKGLKAYKARLTHQLEMCAFDAIQKAFLNNLLIKCVIEIRELEQSQT